MNQAIIGSDNGFSPGWRQAIIWTNSTILLIGPLGITFSENSIDINTSSFKKMHLKKSKQFVNASLKFIFINKNLKQVIIGFDGLELHRCQAVIWGHDGLVYRCPYASIGIDELKDKSPEKRSRQSFGVISSVYLIITQSDWKTKRIVLWCYIPIVSDGRYGGSRTIHYIGPGATVGTHNNYSPYMSWCYLHNERCCDKATWKYTLIILYFCQRWSLMYYSIATIV